jgi:hypothetical protein
VLDLAGLKEGRKVLANMEHDASKRVGHATSVTKQEDGWHVEGVLSAATPHREEIVQSSMSGFPWDVSIEGNLHKIEKLAKGETSQVNGRTVSGPLFIVRQTEFTGISFVSQGADPGNTVTIAASDKTAAGDKQMNEFEKFMVSCGVDPESVSDEHRANLQLAFDAKTKAAKSEKDSSRPAKTLRQMADAERAELKRVETIQTMTLQAIKENPVLIDQIELAGQQAIEDGTDPDKYELDLLRATRLRAGTFVSSSRNGGFVADPQIIEAALCLSAGLPNIEKAYPAEVLNNVERAGLRSFGLQQLLLQVAHSNGYICRPGERITTGNLRTVLEYCFPPVTARLSGFSTINLPGILGNVANKEILAGYMEEDGTWMEIAQVKSVNNFHLVTSYRMLDNLEYEEVGPAGEIKHGTLDQESYTRQAKTYAKMLGLTRQDIINDDLGAFDDIRTRLGRGAAKKFNNIFWAAFMDNSSFFTTARTNYMEGATTNLGADGVGLGLGVTKYRKMTSPTADGTKRVGASMSRPEILLVPPELEFVARQLFVSSNYITGANATTLASNVFVNLYRPVVQNRLSDSAFTGNSATAWYLFGMELKPMVVSFLNGQRTPTVESSDADFDQLGIQFRGFHDFGSDKSEYLSGIKSKGAA